MKFKKYEVKLPVNLWDHVCRSIDDSEVVSNFIIQFLIIESGNLSEFHKIYNEIAGKKVVVETELDIKTLEYFFENIHGYCVHYNDSRYPMLNLPIPINCIEDFKKLGE